MSATTKRIVTRGDRSLWLTLADGYATLAIRDGNDIDYRRVAFYVTPRQANKLADELLAWLEKESS